MYYSGTMFKRLFKFIGSLCGNCEEDAIEEIIVNVITDMAE